MRRTFLCATIASLLLASAFALGARSASAQGQLPPPPSDNEKCANLDPSAARVVKVEVETGYARANVGPCGSAVVDDVTFKAGDTYDSRQVYIHHTAMLVLHDWDGLGPQTTVAYEGAGQATLMQSGRDENIMSENGGGAPTIKFSGAGRFDVAFNSDQSKHPNDVNEDTVTDMPHTWVQVWDGGIFELHNWTRVSVHDHASVTADNVVRLHAFDSAKVYVTRCWEAGAFYGAEIFGSCVYLNANDTKSTVTPLESQRSTVHRSED
jgi:hypothetical protein